MLSLAWRNSWRHRRRSLLTATAVALVVALTLLLFGLSDAMRNGMFENLTATSGHLVVRVEGWRDARRFDERLIRDAAAVVDRIGATAERVERAERVEIASVLEFTALLAGEVRSRGIHIVGIGQPASLRRRYSDDYLAEGRLPEVGGIDQIALGASLARSLEIGVGDVAYAYAPGTEGYGAGAYTVVGLLDFPESAMESRSAVLPLAAAQEIAAPGSVTRFEIHLPDLTQLSDEGSLDDLQQRLAAELGPRYAVETWRQANPDLATILDLLEPILLFYAAIFFGIAGLLVVNTIYLGQVERIREFGIIIALGASRWRVMGMVFLESTVLVLSGAALGVLLGLVAVARLHRGFHLPLGLAEIYAEFGLPTVLHAGLTPTQLVLTLAFTVAMAFVAALWPAWMAGRLEPAEAARFVA